MSKTTTRFAVRVIAAAIGVAAIGFGKRDRLPMEASESLIARGWG